MRDVLIGISNTAFSKALLFVIQIVVSTILARNLSSEDYGIVGFAGVIFAFLVRIQGMGLIPAIIRMPEFEKNTLNTAATLNLVFSITAFLISQILAPFAGLLTKSQASVTVIRILSFGFLFAPIGFLPTALLTKEMRFARLRTPSVIGAFIRGVVSVSLAISGWKYWSLVLGNLSEMFSRNFFLHVLYHAKFKLNLEHDEVRKLISFGLPITISGLITFAVLNADNFFIGSILGVSMLGYYSVAFNWATFGCSAVNEIVHSVLFPKFSQFQNNIERMRNGYLKSLRIIAFFVTMANLSLFIIADFFLINILGKGSYRWLPALDTLQILCIYGILRSIIETVGNPILALGETKLLFKANSTAAFIEIICLPITAKYFGIVGVSVVITISYISQCFFFIPFINKRLHINLKELFSILFPIAFAGIVSFFLVYIIPIWQDTNVFYTIVRLLFFNFSLVSIHEFLTRCSILSEINHVFCNIFRKGRHR